MMVKPDMTLAEAVEELRRITDVLDELAAQTELEEEERRRARSDDA